MSITEVLRRSFQGSVDLYAELAAELPEAALGMKLPGLPSNSIGEQLWCVVGARESYSRAIEAGSWGGFSCSLTRAALTKKVAVQLALASSAERMLAAVGGMDSFGDDRNRLVADLLGHEAAHQGQLIRYLYGNRMTIPAGWKAKYSLG